MPRVEVIAKKDIFDILKKGEKATIVPILYEEDTLIRNEIFGIFDKNLVMVKIFEQRDLARNLEGLTIKKISDKLYAPKGSYKSSYIELSDGRQISDTIFRRSYEEYFVKVN